jgi:hypothetical protein
MLLDWIPDVVYIYGSPFLIGLATFLIVSGVSKAHRSCWWRVLAGLAISVLVGLWSIDLASRGGMGGVGAVITTLFALVAVVVVALGMLVSLRGWWKLTAALPVVLFPLVLFGSIVIGHRRSPKSVTQDNGDVIVQALDDHYATTGSYPPELARLVPAYLATLPEALTTQGTGWLYDSSGDGFTLGYWQWPGKFGSSYVCLYTSVDETWECEFDQWGPFKAVSTPTPSGPGAFQ